MRRSWPASPLRLAQRFCLPDGLRPTRADEGLPELPEFSLLLLKAQTPRQPATNALYAHIVDTFGVESLAG